MKKILSFSAILLVAVIASFQFVSFGQIKKANKKFKQNKIVSQTHYQVGDIIFQASNSRQCEAVKLATHSNVSHCGVLIKENNQWKVLEAVEPVQIIPLNEFIHRGIGNHYTIKRLKPTYSISESQRESMMSYGKQWIGRHYDIYFNSSDIELYCSELVWKIYKQNAHIELCALKPLKAYDLKDNFVGVLMKERYGDNIPFNEPMVAPSDIFNSEKLELVENK